MEYLETLKWSEAPLFVAVVLTVFIVIPLLALLWADVDVDDNEDT